MNKLLNLQKTDLVVHSRNKVKGFTALNACD